MPIEKKPFVNYKLDSEKDDRYQTITIRLNEDEQALLRVCKKILEQPKDGTAIKALMRIGAYVLHEEKTAYILANVFKNKRNNKRTGLTDFD